MHLLTVKDPPCMLAFARIGVDGVRFARARIARLPSTPIIVTPEWHIEMSTVGALSTAMLEHLQTDLVLVLPVTQYKGWTLDPWYDVPWSPAAKRELDAAAPILHTLFPRLQHQVTAYHGTGGPAARSILQTHLHHSTIGMLGPAQYFGSFNKSARFGLMDSYSYEPRREPSSVRFVMDVGLCDVRGGTRTDWSQLPCCTCRRCRAWLAKHGAAHGDVRLRMQDHAMAWAREFDSVLYLPGSALEWAPGKRLLRQPELAVDPATVRAIGLDARLVESRGIPKHHDPGFRHRTCADLPSALAPPTLVQEQTHGGASPPRDRARSHRGRRR